MVFFDSGRHMLKSVLLRLWRREWLLPMVVVVWWNCVMGGFRLEGNEEYGGGFALCLSSRGSTGWSICMMQKVCNGYWSGVLEE